MDELTLLAALQRYWQFAATDPDRAHEMYHEDAVLEFPQSQERFEGKANFLPWRKLYPAQVEARIRRVRGGGDFWVAELSIRYDSGAWNYGCSILEFRGDKVALRGRTKHLRDRRTNHENNRCARRPWPAGNDGF